MKRIHRMKWGLLLGMLSISSMVSASTIGITTADVSNIRKTPSATGEVVRTVGNGTSLNIVERAQEYAGWYKVMLAPNKTAYVKDEFIKVTTVTGTVTEDNLNFRSYPSLSQSKVMGKLPIGTELTILYKVDQFYKVLVDGAFGFVYADYVKVPFADCVATQNIANVKEIAYNAMTTDKPIVPMPKPVEGQVDSTTSETEMSQNMTEGNAADSLLDMDNTLNPITESKGIEIVNYAIQFVGNPYVYGGNDLLTGVDCSGFTQQVMKAFQFDIPRSSRDQSKVGIAISDLSMAQAGDLIFFGSSIEDINHVGIYIGENYMVHSSTEETGIIISDLSQKGFSSIQVIRRMGVPR